VAIGNHLKRILAKLQEVQARRPVLAVPLAVVKRFGEHGGGRLAASISYWSFFSLFPLLLAFVTILNIVLQDDDTTRQDLVDGALGQIPVIGSQLGAEHPLGGSWLAVSFGLLGAVWAGLAAVNALQAALDEIWDVPRFQRPNGAVKRAKALAFLVLLAVGIGVSTVASNAADIIRSTAVVTALGLLVTFVVDAALLLATFWLLTTGRNPVRTLWPGTVFSAAGLVGLQVLGTWVVQRYIKGASDTYGTFAVVIALLSWFFLLSRVVLYGAELNGVLARQVWPRTMVGEGELTRGDRRASELDAERVQIDERLVSDRVELCAE
jgi:YihY family inner membrane protein